LVGNYWRTWLEVVGGRIGWTCWNGSMNLDGAGSIKQKLILVEEMALRQPHPSFCRDCLILSPSAKCPAQSTVSHVGVELDEIELDGVNGLEDGDALEDQENQIHFRKRT
jgi:hypothetical protein